MTQNIELLLKDICTRLPYGVCVEHTSGFRGTLHNLTVYFTYNDDDTIKDYMCYTNFFGDESCKIEFFKPYLFPLSSMTDEQHNEFFTYFHEVEKKEIETSGDYLKAAYLGENAKRDWLNKNHFDYRYLIEKGLAIDATGLNIY